MCDILSHCSTIARSNYREPPVLGVSFQTLRELSSTWPFLLDRPTFLEASKVTWKHSSITFCLSLSMNNCLLFLAWSINHTVSPNQQTNLNQCFSVWPSITILTPCWCFPSPLLLDQMVCVLVSLLSFSDQGTPSKDPCRKSTMWKQPQSQPAHCTHW